MSRELVDDVTKTCKTELKKSAKKLSKFKKILAKAPVKKLILVKGQGKNLLAPSLHRALKIGCLCVKSIQVRRFFWSAFSCIQSEYRKIRTKKNSIFGHFPRSVLLQYDQSLSTDKPIAYLETSFENQILTKSFAFFTKRSDQNILGNLEYFDRKVHIKI